MEFGRRSLIGGSFYPKSIHFFGGIADLVTSIDWYAVGTAVSGTIADLGIAIKEYLDENFGDGKLGDLGYGRL